MITARAVINQKTFRPCLAQRQSTVNSKGLILTLLLSGHRALPVFCSPDGLHAHGTIITARNGRFAWVVMATSKTQYIAVRFLRNDAGDVLLHSSSTGGRF